MGITLNLSDEEANEVRCWADIHIDEEESFENDNAVQRAKKIRRKIQRAKKR